MSRKKTANAAKSMPRPAQNIATNKSNKGRASRLKVGEMRKNSITMTTAIREMAKFTSWNSIFSRGKINFETRIFLISGADSIMELIAPLVESAMRVNRILPNIRYRGKFSMSSPNLRILLNTATSTHIISKGLSTDQSTPRILRRYFSLKSLLTREVIMNQFRFMVPLAANVRAMGSFVVRFGASSLVLFCDNKTTLYFRGFLECSNARKYQLR